MKQLFVCRPKGELISLFFFLVIQTVSAQNVGIGIDPPVRGKLETRGIVGNTLALFGQDQNGISLVANSPGIHFNSYSNLGIRSIQAGQSGRLTFDLATGRFQFHRSPAAAGPDQILTQTLALTIESNGNIIANSYRYTAPHTFYYSIPAADFSSRNSIEWVRKEALDVGAHMVDGDGAWGLIAPVHLPHGSTVTAVTFYYTDNASTSDITMSLVRYDPINSMYGTMAMVSSSGSPGATSSTVNSIVSANIDNSDTSYMIRCTSLPTTWPTSLGIRTVIITYTMIEGN